MSLPWVGGLWGRTGCRETSDGKFTCVTGGCINSTLNCNGKNATDSVTLAEFALQIGVGTVPMDYYDVSLVRGYNLPILLTPGSNKCREIGCAADLNRFYPAELQLLSGDGDIIACLDPCQVFQTPEYCSCTSGPCKPTTTNYSQIFKKACPSAYTSPQDAPTSSLSCPAGADYNITFCPSITSLRTVPGSPPSHEGAAGPSPTPSQGTPTSPSPGQSTPTSPSSGQSTHLSSKGMKQHTRIILVVVSSMVLLVLVIAMFVWWKLKQGEKERKLDELLMLDGSKETDRLNGRRANNRDLRVFSYESILTATNNFSMDCKLGQGGFGSVYKINKGTESANKDVARRWCDIALLLIGFIK